MKLLNIYSSIKKPFPLAVIAVLLNACISSTTPTPSVNAVDTPIHAATPEPEITLDITPDPYAGWQTYQHPSTGFRFQFPGGWFGPEVYEVDQDLRIEIGTDVVYPYGTDRTEQIYTQPNSYYLLIRYRPNTANQTLEDYAQSPWIAPLLEILALADGETITTARSLTIRVGAFSLNGFTGVEYIATLSDTAQTERAYSRHLFLMDEDLNILMISGIPNNVEVTDPSTWKDDYQRVDESHLEIFYQIIASLVIE